MKELIKGFAHKALKYNELNIEENYYFSYKSAGFSINESDIVDCSDDYIKMNCKNTIFKLKNIKSTSQKDLHTMYIQCIECNKSLTLSYFGNASCAKKPKKIVKV